MPAMFFSRTERQRKHALARADVKGDHPDAAADQSIPSYNGFHAGLNMEQGKSKACFHMSYSQAPLTSQS